MLFSLTTPPNKSFDEDIKFFKSKIEYCVNFSFSKYADGEWVIQLKRITDEHRARLPRAEYELCYFNTGNNNIPENPQRVGWRPPAPDYSGAVGPEPPGQLGYAPGKYNAQDDTAPAYAVTQKLPGGEQGKT